MKAFGITEWKWYNSKYEAAEKSMKKGAAEGPAERPAEASDLELKYTRMNRKDQQSIQRDTVQVHKNPYFANHNYIDDLKNEDLFLRPRNSHDEKSI
jgi:hypothetical protein